MTAPAASCRRSTRYMQDHTTWGQADAAQAMLVGDHAAVRQGNDRHAGGEDTMHWHRYEQQRIRVSSGSSDGRLRRVSGHRSRAGQQGDRQSHGKGERAIVFVLLAAFALAERAASTPVADPHRRRTTRPMPNRIGISMLTRMYMPNEAMMPAHSALLNVCSCLPLNARRPWRAHAGERMPAPPP